ncbi:hypothetical protein GGR56DRAFT_660535 [Xylariaceae sp. FL0804]|nr:hypothetical protein GGR56DRAFT_660535 [Xylariaceae sp. FL0804]
MDQHLRPSLTARRHAPGPGLHLLHFRLERCSQARLLPAWRVRRFQQDQTVRFNVQPGQRVAQVMSPAFDGSIHEIFSALSYGGTLVLPQSTNDLGHLAMSDAAILTPSLARILSPVEYPRLKQIYLVGEPVPQQVCDTWAKTKRVYNMYGPTESTCGATIEELRQAKPVTIGRPNLSSRVYILDRHRRPCPPNVIGDLFIAGVQVADGYLGLTDANATRFLPDPFVQAKERMYLTGDRGCWTSNGDIRCLGRSDRQIKLSGFRLDLGSLEEQIVEGIGQLTAAAVVRRYDYLQVAVVPSTVDKDAVRLQLGELLPGYAVPRYVFPMDTLPKTAIDKVDYAAIEALEPSWSLPKPTESLTATEQEVASHLKRILGLDQQTTLSPQSTIQGLGGDSLTQLALTNCLSQTRYDPILLRNIIQAFTPRDIARAIERPSPTTLDQAPCSAPYNGVSRLEASWMARYRRSRQASAFNVSLAWQFSPSTIDRDRLVAAWNSAIARNHFFSAYFVEDPVRGPQKKYHDQPPRVEVICHLDWNQCSTVPFNCRKTRSYAYLSPIPRCS